jgi:hypothetical protein
MFRFTSDCLDRWLEDFEAFNYDFTRYCNFLARGIGYNPEVNFSLLKAAHEGWHSQCRLWATTYVAADSEGLSHFKIMSILLDKLASFDWVLNLYPFDPTDDRREGEYVGTPAQQEESRRDLNAGRGAFLAFQFVIDVLNAFEIARDDCRQRFEFRLTTDLEHDMMVYLLSEHRNAMAIYLILKALYARDPK